MRKRSPRFFKEEFAMSVSPAEKVHINADFEKILANYPANNQLPPALQQKIDALNKPYFPHTPNTSCCLQVCHAFNKTGIRIPSGNFRPGEPERVAEQIPFGSGVYYLMAVNEMINYLSRTFGDPIVLGAAHSASDADIADFTAPVRGLEGVMTFGNGHIELWNRYNIVQDSGAMIMSAKWVWSQKPVRFWRIGSSAVATPLSGSDATRFDGWWDINDGEQYYYYIDATSRKVTYTKGKPANSATKNMNVRLNIGDITMVSGDLVFDWDPADGGATRETFTLDSSDPTTMKGRSNRYGNLLAKKMFG
jgi:hypothetical protein